MKLFLFKKIAITLIIIASYDAAQAAQQKDTKTQNETLLRPSKVLYGDVAKHKFFNHGEDNPGPVHQVLDATIHGDPFRRDASCCIIVYIRNAVNAPCIMFLKNVSMAFSMADLKKRTGTEALYYDTLCTTEKEDAELDRANELSGEALAKHYKNAFSTIILPKLKTRDPLEDEETLLSLSLRDCGPITANLYRFEGLIPPLNNAAEGSEAYRSAIPTKWPNQIEAEEKINAAQKIY